MKSFLYSTKKPPDWRFLLAPQFKAYYNSRKQGLYGNDEREIGGN
jgi:hypothetical protein